MSRTASSEPVERTIAVIILLSEMGHGDGIGVLGAIIPIRRDFLNVQKISPIEAIHQFII
jgi:hypothetical protein